VEDSSREISLEEARWDDADFEVGDVLEIPVDFTQFGRNAVMALLGTASGAAGPVRPSGTGPFRPIRLPCTPPGRVSRRLPTAARLQPWMRPTATGSCREETTPPATSTVRANPAISPDRWKAATSGVGPSTPAEITCSATMAHSW